MRFFCFSVLLIEFVTGFVDRGFWLLNKFQHEADCEESYTISIDKSIWRKAASVLNQTALVNDDSIEQLTSVLTEITSPFGVSDPNIALQCPLAVAALLQRLALTLFNSSQSTWKRVLRMIHLAKLFYLHKYPDLGEFLESTRWPVSINDMMLVIRETRNFERSNLEQIVAEDSRTSTDEHKVEIVSYCYYPGNGTQLPRWSRENKNAYADHWGISIKHYNTPLARDSHAWMNKLLALEGSLASDVDWVMWVDCDAFFMNWEVHPQSVLASTPNSANLVISEDANMLNSGVFFLRNCEWSRNFLKTIKGLLNAPSPFSFRDNAYHEQSPMMYWLFFPTGLELGSSNLSPGYRPEVYLVYQKIINAYPPEIALKSSFLQHDVYEKGDWIVSFNGCGSLLGGEYCESMWSRYFDMSFHK